ncbi:MAG: citrate lyase subunit beta / citryl-CoA lyase [Alphaproteobacteria bacterium]|nr:citrate lyase subunit beta / citryl-CoA lyase [Alphaproteobacteria bacterium]
MANKARPRRSVLYMPGSNARAMEKARTIPADALILDLEDAVAPDAKLTAREQVCAALREGGYGKREMIVRVNALDTPWGLADLTAAAAVKPDAVLIPKVSSPAVLHQAEALLDAHGAHDTALWAMMETPLGILHAEAIAAATPRLAVFIMGTNDIAKEVRAAHTPMRLPMITSLGLCLLAARAYGVGVIDGVYNDFKDEAGFAAICLQGLELGMDGKTLIHPGQVVPCNEIFSPSPDEVELARKIIAEFAKPENAGKGVITVDGRMTEILHAEMAKRTVAIADAIRELEAA